MREAAVGTEPEADPVELGEREHGPFDATELDLEQTDAVGRFDFGAVRVPMPDEARLQVETAPGGRLKAVHVLVTLGRLSISALAAPRSAPVWPALADEIVATLKKDGARVRQQAGPWGREVLAGTPTAQCLFVGVDGPRWMLYGVATGPAEGVGELAEVLRDMLRGTIVVRDEQAFPVRTVLPLTPPVHLNARLERLESGSAPAGQPPAVPAAPRAEPSVPNARHPEHSNPGSPSLLPLPPAYQAHPAPPPAHWMAPPVSRWVPPPPSHSAAPPPSGLPVHQLPPRAPVPDMELPTPPSWPALDEWLAEPPGAPEPVAVDPQPAQLTDDPLSWILPDLDRPAGRHRRPD